MPRIRLLTLMAGPNGTRQAGTVYNAPRAEAAALVKAGSAVLVKEETKKKERKKETADTTPPENAAQEPVTRGRGLRDS